MSRISKVTITAAFALLAASILFSGQAVSAKNSADEHKIGKVEDFGDGIKVANYADGSGFEAVGGGGRFVYLSDSKLLKYTDANGDTRTFTFAQ